MFTRYSPLLLLSCFLPGVVPVWAEAPSDHDTKQSVPGTIAGRTVDDYAAELNSEHRVVRLRAVRSLAAFGTAAGAALGGALTHDDAAVRYLAAENLGGIGGKPLQNATSQLKKLANDETSLAVRLAACYALCRGGLIDEHLPLLMETLRYPERGMVCSAAELIGNIGPSAAAAIDTLEEVHQKNRPGVTGGDYHIGGATMNALRKIREQQD